MAAHETKTCPRCTGQFECKLGTIALCQCSGIRLALEERSFIEQCYSDCLCRQCLLEMQLAYTLYREKYILSKRDR
jgi:hypothetical protein